jgi:predicted nucleic acid-binding protein
MGRKWVINASPLISLAKIGQLQLIEELCPNPIIPLGVAKEVFQGPEHDPAKQWLAGGGKNWIREVAGVNPAIIAWDLGQGESEVLSWVYSHPDHTAVLDDRAARNCSRALGVKVIGTIGIILLAKNERKLVQVLPLLRQLEESGFRIEGNLLQAAMELAGETERK